MRVETDGADCAGRSRECAIALRFGFSALLILALCGIFTATTPGPRSAQMAQHILTMNAIAPLMALGAATWFSPEGALSGRRWLAFGAVGQLCLFYAWHLPGVLAGAADRPLIHGAMHLALLCSSFLFWRAIFSLDAAALWFGVVTLALTGKLVCLLGALLLLARHPLDGDFSASALHDQRMAGLMMLAICPFAYLFAAVDASVRWLRAVEARAAPVRKT